VLFSRHKLAEAAQLNVELLDRVKTLAGEESPVYAATLCNFGLCRAATGSDEEGVSCLQRAATIYEALGSEFDVPRAKCLGVQSAALRRLNRLQEAEVALRSAVAAVDRAGARDPAELAAMLRALADLYQSEQRLAEAIPLLDQVVTIRKSVFGGDHPETRESWARLALAHHRAGDFERARPFYELAFGLAVESAPKPGVRSGHDVRPG
jgi:tetratricopeptide (TPR) repeat protein